MSAQPDDLTSGPLSEYTVGAIRAILTLYDRRQITLQAAIAEVTSLVERDRADRPVTADEPGKATPPSVANPLARRRIPEPPTDEP